MDSIIIATAHETRLILAPLKDLRVYHVRQDEDVLLRAGIAHRKCLVQPVVLATSGPRHCLEGQQRDILSLDASISGSTRFKSRIIINFGVMKVEEHPSFCDVHVENEYCIVTSALKRKA